MFSSRPTARRSWISYLPSDKPNPQKATKPGLFGVPGFFFHIMVRLAIQISRFHDLRPNPHDTLLGRALSQLGRKNTAGCKNTNKI